ncbi:hypothetical protein [Pedobacter gandavensis]|uniref:hypothetical protein n=1 Tax=Pedobacter gandavensis TaxID=2679963 RepID=UPI002931873D|nr:hypothetical protein [Pedobacter gandavensis]
MDRLIMESVLSDVSGFNLTKDSRDGFIGSLVMGFSADRMLQVNHVFSELNNMVKTEDVQLLICKTMVDGIYDLEICTAVLDEPVRISNRAIPKDMIHVIESHAGDDPKLLLGAAGLPVGNWLGLAKIEVKNCKP